MDWAELLRADGVTVVGLLLVGIVVVSIFYIRLLNRFLTSLEEENSSLNAAILRRDQDDRDVVREATEKLEQVIYRLDHAEGERRELKRAVELLLRAQGVRGSE